MSSTPSIADPSRPRRHRPPSPSARTSGQAETTALSRCSGARGEPSMHRCGCGPVPSRRRRTQRRAYRPWQSYWPGRAQPSCTCKGWAGVSPVSPDADVGREESSDGTGVRRGRGGRGQRGSPTQKSDAYERSPEGRPACARVRACVCMCACVYEWVGACACACMGVNVGVCACVFGGGRVDSPCREGSESVPIYGNKRTDDWFQDRNDNPKGRHKLGAAKE